MFHTLSTPFVLRPVSSWEEGEEDQDNFSSAILQCTCSFEPTLSVLHFKLQDKIRNGKSGFIAICLHYKKLASEVLDKYRRTGFNCVIIAFAQIARRGGLLIE